jgi:formylglycine-generating enzyme required for sulfatase activity
LFQGGNTCFQVSLLYCHFFWSDLSMSCFHLFQGRWTRLSLLSVAAGALATVASMAAPSVAGVVTFGSGTNEFQMEFVTIGNPGNADDFTGNANNRFAGAVAYEYGLGKYEVSEDMIDKYNANFGTANNLQITKNERGTAKPATAVSWNEAARFVNWLNTSTGGFAAYKFTTDGVDDNIDLWTAADTLDYEATNPYRSKRATYVLPSANEWYKAAYYNPNDGTYYDFPTGSDTIPTAVASGTGTGVNGNNEAVYGGQLGPADVNQAGGLSPYGVMGLGGNVWEADESSLDLTNSSSSSYRGMRGGDWVNYFGDLATYSRGANDPTLDYAFSGFRVASLSSDAPPAVPEPSMMVIGTLFGLGGLVAKRRMKK